MNETTKFKVPSNTEFIEQTMENGILITKFIPKEEYLKELGCYRILNSNGMNGFLIMKDKKHAYINIWPNGNIIKNDKGSFSINEKDENITKITREEMQAELAKHGKVFDFENKVLNNLKLRAENKTGFFYIGAGCTPIHAIDMNTYLDDILFETGNYFLTEQECKEFCDKVRNILK